MKTELYKVTCEMPCHAMCEPLVTFKVKATDEQDAREQAEENIVKAIQAGELPNRMKLIDISKA